MEMLIDAKLHQRVEPVLCVDPLSSFRDSYDGMFLFVTLSSPDYNVSPRSLTATQLKATPSLARDT